MLDGPISAVAELHLAFLGKFAGEIHRAHKAATGRLGDLQIALEQQGTREAILSKITEKLEAEPELLNQSCGHALGELVEHRRAVHKQRAKEPIARQTFLLEASEILSTRQL